MGEDDGLARRRLRLQAEGIKQQRRRARAGPHEELPPGEIACHRHSS